MGLKRVVYLFFLALVVGLVLVNLRTRHMQSVYRMSCLVEQEQQVRQALWQQQLRLSGALESPERIKEQLERLQVGLCPPGTTEDEIDQEID